jgi:hypothetical protein
MFVRTPAFIFYPLLLLWSLSYGIVGGAFFKLIAVYENWRTINHYHFLLWKKYPQRSYQKYISALWATQIRGVPLEFADYTRQRIEKSHPSEPFPLLRLLFNSLFMLLITPYMVLVGMCKGPFYVFTRAVAARKDAQQHQ